MIQMRDPEVPHKTRVQVAHSTVWGFLQNSLNFFSAFFAVLIGSTFTVISFLDVAASSSEWLVLLWLAITVLGVIYIAWQYQIVSSLLARGEEVRARVVTSRRAVPFDLQRTWGTHALLEYSFHGRTYRLKKVVNQKVDPGEEVILLVDGTSPRRVLLQRTMDSPDPRLRA